MINEVIVSSKPIDRTCSSAPPTTSAPRITALRMESQDIVTQVDSSMITALREAVKDCGDRGLQFASKWSVVIAGRIPSMSYPGFITQGCGVACIHPSPETVYRTQWAVRFDDRTVHLDASKIEDGTNSRHGTKSPPTSPRSEITKGTRTYPITRTRA